MNKKIKKCNNNNNSNYNSNYNKIYGQVKPPSTIIFEPVQ